MILSPTELAVVKLYAVGWKTEAIAIERQCSAKTICKHVEKIYQKLGIHDKANLVHWAIANGIVPLITNAKAPMT